MIEIIKQVIEQIRFRRAQACALAEPERIPSVTLQAYSSCHVFAVFLTLNILRIGCLIPIHNIVKIDTSAQKRGKFLQYRLVWFVLPRIGNGFVIMVSVVGGNNRWVSGDISLVHWLISCFFSLVLFTPPRSRRDGDPFASICRCYRRMTERRIYSWYPIITSWYTVPGAQ